MHTRWALPALIPTLAALLLAVLPALVWAPVAYGQASFGPAGGSASTPLASTSASLGGTLLTVGACASTATTVPGAAVGMAVVATPTTYPGAGNLWDSYVSAPNTVTTQVCALVVITPNASTYNIRVLR